MQEPVKANKSQKMLQYVAEGRAKYLIRINMLQLLQMLLKSSSLFLQAQRESRQNHARSLSYRVRKKNKNGPPSFTAKRAPKSKIK